MRGKRRTFTATLAVLAILVAVPAATSAQEAPEGVSATVAFRESTATIGDRVALVVRVEHPESVVVTIPLPVIPDAEVRSAGETTTTVTPEGTQVTETTFLYQVFALGPVETGPVPVRWIQDDGTGGSFAAPGAQFTIVSVRPPGDEALRPLKPPLTIEGAPPAWLLPAGVALGVLALVGLVVLAVRRLRRRAPEEESLPLDVPEQSARERLAAVQHAGLPDEEEFQRFYGTIAAVVREYLGDRFGFNATALTSSELEARMTSHGVDRWQARLVSGLLERCDLAVYARHYPDPASADHDLTVAFEIVELSRPRRAEANDEVEAEAVAS